MPPVGRETLTLLWRSYYRQILGEWRGITLGKHIPLVNFWPQISIPGKSLLVLDLDTQRYCYKFLTR
jgi:hypothetical protein